MRLGAPVLGCPPIFSGNFSRSPTRKQTWSVLEQILVDW